jgi:hypothetical protein
MLWITIDPSLLYEALDACHAVRGVVLGVDRGEFLLLLLLTDARDSDPALFL